MRGRLRVGCGRYPSVHGARALRLSLRRKGAALGRRQLLRAPPRSPRSRCRWWTYWSTHSTGHHGVSRATGGATAVGTQEVGVRAHISCSIWSTGGVQGHRAPSTFKLGPPRTLPRAITWVLMRLAKSEGAASPAFHANCRWHPSIVRHQPSSFSTATPAETTGAGPVMCDSEHPNFSTDLWKLG